MRLPFRLLPLLLVGVAWAPELLRAQTPPDGSLYLANLTPLPGATASGASGTATIQVSSDGSSATVDVLFSNLSSEEVTAHLTVGGTGANGTFVFALGTGQVVDKLWTFTPTGNFTSASLLSALASGQLYVEIDTTTYSSGELGGKFLLGSGSETFTPPPPPPPVNLSVVSQSDAARFLTQATFGPVDADLQRVSAIGYSAWLDQQMAMPPPPRWTSTRPRWAAGWARLLRTCRRSSRI